VNLKFRIVGLGLVLLFGGSAIAPPRATAQNSSLEAGKRKVRTHVAPDYPTLARRMNVTGRVKIEATVSTDGRVINTKVVGGSPLLVNAALDALKKWRFEPAAKESTELVEFDFTGQD
jgi:TonB family protein